jgi:neutral ceramidase
MKWLALFLFLPLAFFAETKAGVAATDLTPPIGAPSAGYTKRNGAPMQGVHDPLLAIALVLETDAKCVALCSVDHLGFTYEMVEEIIRRVRREGLDCEILIGSSHTHSGGGAFYNIPGLGESLAGPYDPEIVEMYMRQTALAIMQAWSQRVPAKVGIGYGKAPNVSCYRGKWPRDQSASSEVSLIKVERKDGSPLAALFNFPVHPTVLKEDNLLFSADFVGYARNHLQSLLGRHLQPLYFNGAQGDIIPLPSDETTPFEACEILGDTLAETVAKIWEETSTSDELSIDFLKDVYEFAPRPTPAGIAFPIPLYKSEMNLLVLNQTHAFVSIPGELSCVYDRRLKQAGRRIGFGQVSIFGLTNDAHGYIILPESYQHRTFESYLSFGGETYGDEMEKRALSLLETLAPSKHNSLLK